MGMDSVQQTSLTARGAPPPRALAPRVFAPPHAPSLGGFAPRWGRGRSLAARKYYFRAERFRASAIIGSSETAALLMVRNALKDSAPLPALMASFVRPR